MKMKSKMNMKSKSSKTSKVNIKSEYPQMAKIMMGMMKHPAKPQSNVDRNYAAQMTVHHPAADKMSKIEIKDGKNKAMKTIAKQILKSQPPQERAFKKFLRSKKS